MNIVEKFGGISVPNLGDFRDFKSPQGKNFHRRNGTARGPIPEVAAGGVETKEFFPGRLDVGIAAAEAGFRFRADQSRGRRMLELTRHQKQRERQKQRRRVAESCDSGIDPARVLLIWVVR